MNATLAIVEKHITIARFRHDKEAVSREICNIYRMIPASSTYLTSEKKKVLSLPFEQCFAGTMISDIIPISFLNARSKNNVCVVTATLI